MHKRSSGGQIGKMTKKIDMVIQLIKDCNFIDDVIVIKNIHVAFQIKKAHPFTLKKKWNSRIRNLVINKSKLWKVLFSYLKRPWLLQQMPFFKTMLQKIDILWMNTHLSSSQKMSFSMKEWDKNVINYNKLFGYINFWHYANNIYISAHFCRWSLAAWIKILKVLFLDKNWDQSDWTGFS